MAKWVKVLQDIFGPAELANILPDFWNLLCAVWVELLETGSFQAG